jgi:pseudouridine synthase
MHTLNAVGRLDSDSEGLILLSDDGDFINAMTHPRHEVWKIYKVWVRGRPSHEDMKRLEGGIEFEGEKALPAKARAIRLGDNNSLIEVSIREGKNRQVRKMCDAIGCPVRSLKRIAIGPVRLGKLLSGKWRELKPQEVLRLISISKVGDTSEPGGPPVRRNASGKKRYVRAR